VGEGFVPNANKSKLHVLCMSFMYVPIADGIAVTVGTAMTNMDRYRLSHVGSAAVRVCPICF